ncbi:MAG TPA: hypothetical protein VKE41_08510 [Roseiflexaceae bacterium]|nr:hypothetical protein [Roseiflexaceae bacterium]
MTEETLRELIAGGETATVEFKSSATRPIEVAVRMCGMANNGAGGIITFGMIPRLPGGEESAAPAA